MAIKPSNEENDGDSEPTSGAFGRLRAVGLI